MAGHDRPEYPIEQKESIRWLQNVQQSTALLGCPDECIHVGDHECDIYELFSTAQELGTHFLVRTCADRLCGDGTHTVAQEMCVCAFCRRALSAAGILN